MQNFMSGPIYLRAPAFRPAPAPKRNGVSQNNAQGVEFFCQEEQDETYQQEESLYGANRVILSKW